jgi:ATP-binding cassette subfamily F protein 3
MLNVSSIAKFAGGSPLFSDVSFQVYEGEKVGLVGPNGAGKTTLFRMIVAEEQPDSGAIRTLLAAFLFRGDEVFKKLKILSGGEKTRVVLSHLLSTPYNCLVLDEPTNHLDIASRIVLLDALKRYDGTVLVVSHDRYFLRELVSRVFEVDRGEIRVYEGDYRYYLEERERLGTV